MFLTSNIYRMIFSMYECGDIQSELMCFTCKNLLILSFLSFCYQQGSSIPYQKLIKKFLGFIDCLLFAKVLFLLVMKHMTNKHGFGSVPCEYHYLIFLFDMTPTLTFPHFSSMSSSFSAADPSTNLVTLTTQIKCHPSQESSTFFTDELSHLFPRVESPDQPTQTEGIEIFIECIITFVLCDLALGEQAK